VSRSIFLLSSRFKRRRKQLPLTIDHCVLDSVELANVEIEASGLARLTLAPNARTFRLGLVVALLAMVGPEARHVVAQSTESLIFAAFSPLIFLVVSIV